MALQVVLGWGITTPPPLSAKGRNGPLVGGNFEGEEEAMTRNRQWTLLTAAIATASLFSCNSAEPGSRVTSTQEAAPSGDELGMARELGPATWARCATELSNPAARVYELSHPRSGSMPLSPFAGPYEPNYLPSAGLAGTTQLFNMEVLNESANPGQQGTQIDAFGHFASLDDEWVGTSELASDGARYYGGLHKKT